MRSLRNIISVLISIFLICVLVGYIFKFNKSEFIYLLILMSEIMVLGFGIGSILEYLKGNKRESKEYFFLVIIIILIFVIGYQIENNSKYTSRQLHNKGNELIQVYFDWKDTKMGVYNPMATYLATSYFKRALELNPGYAEARIKLAEYYFNKGKYDKVISQCSLLKSEIRQNNGKVLEMEGIAYVYLGKIQLAEKNYYRLKELNINSIDLYWLIYGF